MANDKHCWYEHTNCRSNLPDLLQELLDIQEFL